MIKVSIDEALAYDMLSILTIKRDRSALDGGQMARLHEEIGTAVGWDLHSEVLTSTAYNRLYETNRALFDLIDKLKAGRREDARCYDTEIDGLNYGRYQLKQLLQSTFFPDNPLTEQKLGYTT